MSSDKAFGLGRGGRGDGRSLLACSDATGFSSEKNSEASFVSISNGLLFCGEG
jgi:hypothetical protein